MKCIIIRYNKRPLLGIKKKIKRKKKTFDQIHHGTISSYGETGAARLLPRLTPSGVNFHCHPRLAVNNLRPASTNHKLLAADAHYLRRTPADFYYFYHQPPTYDPRRTLPQGIAPPTMVAAHHPRFPSHTNQNISCHLTSDSMLPALPTRRFGTRLQATFFARETCVVLTPFFIA